MHNIRLRHSLVLLQCSEAAGVFLPQESCSPTAPSPPPAYDMVIAGRPQGKGEEEDDSGLPSYAAALRLGAQGYV